jgi:hypothetical protein
LRGKQPIFFNIAANSAEMKSIKAKNTGKPTTNEPLFTKENYKWMLIGVIVLVIGFLAMMGGKSQDPNIFNDDSVYSFRRITLAPILIIAGLIIEIYAIMKKPAA